jgi:hypothetical protein
MRNTTAASVVLKSTTPTGRHDMFRALTVLAAVVALAVSAAPASAATSTKATSSGTAQGRVGGKMHLEDISLGIVTDKSLPRAE